MSSGRRSRGTSTMSEDQIADLLSKLQHLIPQIRRHRRSSTEKFSGTRVLQETCNYIRSLHREMDDLSERLSELLASTDDNTVQAAIIRSLLT